MENKIEHFRNIIVEAEKNKIKLVLEKLPYEKSDLEPVMSQRTIDYHYGKLAKTYVDRFNNNEGDDQFNRAGAFLHNIFFPQLKSPSGSNKPFDHSLEFINRHFNSFDNLKSLVEKTAMGIQGSGWVYISTNGKIKTIVNHEIKNDILLLIDWWEHAWALDYEQDKGKYLKNIWKIINWTVINDRINTKGEK